MIQIQGEASETQPPPLSYAQVASLRGDGRDGGRRFSSKRNGEPRNGHPPVATKTMSPCPHGVL